MTVPIIEEVTKENFFTNKVETNSSKASSRVQASIFQQRANSQLLIGKTSSKKQFMRKDSIVNSMMNS